ncbi:MAG: hypothetical protein VXZ82_07800 [Planctomycetota bacterium]|nr:hypothetical protein [Planctomycetota bacterium]
MGTDPTGKIVLDQIVLDQIVLDQMGLVSVGGMIALIILALFFLGVPLLRIVFSSSNSDVSEWVEKGKPEPSFTYRGKSKILITVPHVRMVRSEDYHGLANITLCERKASTGAEYIVTIEGWVLGGGYIRDTLEEALECFERCLEPGSLKMEYFHKSLDDVRQGKPLKPFYLAAAEWRRRREEEGKHNTQTAGKAV